MRQQGVTLIQMMFGLAAAMLLMQLGMPAYSKLSEDMHRAAAIRELAQSLRSARSHALLQGQTVLVQPLNGDWGAGWQVRLEHNQQLLREHRLARALHVESNLRDELKFSALGIPLGRNNNSISAGRLEVCRSSAASIPYQVIMATSGRIRLSTEKEKTSPCPGR